MTLFVIIFINTHLGHLTYQGESRYAQQLCCALNLASSLTEGVFNVVHLAVF
jgi:hypothetical protein